MLTVKNNRQHRKGVRSNILTNLGQNRTDLDTHVTLLDRLLEIVQT